MSALSAIPPPGSYVRLSFEGLVFPNMPSDLDGSPPMSVVLDRIGRRHLRSRLKTVFGDEESRTNDPTQYGYFATSDPHAFELRLLS